MNFRTSIKLRLGSNLITKSELVTPGQAVDSTSDTSAGARRRLHLALPARPCDLHRSRRVKSWRSMQDTATSTLYRNN